MVRPRIKGCKGANRELANGILVMMKAFSSHLPPLLHSPFPSASPTPSGLITGTLVVFFFFPSSLFLFKEFHKCIELSYVLMKFCIQIFGASEAGEAENYHVLNIETSVGGAYFFLMT